jgi:hypothetical protein
VTRQSASVIQLNLLSTSPDEQSQSYDEANESNAAVGDPSLLKNDVLRFWIKAAAQFIETVAPMPVALIK